jgi:multidrug efflux pump
VVLTALAAILGMIPLARSAFWGPMAITILGGLLVATILTLLVVPALYALWFRVPRDKAQVGEPDLQTVEGKVVPIRMAAE